MQSNTARIKTQKTQTPYKPRRTEPEQARADKVKAWARTDKRTAWA